MTNEKEIAAANCIRQRQGPRAKIQAKKEWAACQNQHDASFGFECPSEKDSSVWAEPALLQRPQNQNNPSVGDSNLQMVPLGARTHEKRNWPLH